MRVTLSVVVFTYNHEKYIEKCLDSILMQKTDFGYEVIIADDCSSDGTLEIINKKYNNTVKIARQKANVGLCQNMYEVFKKAEGKYIFECSGDDYLYGDSVFQKHINFLEKNKDFFSVSHWYIHRNENTGQEILKKVPYDEYTFEDFLMGKKVMLYMGTIRNTFKSDDVEYLCHASKNNEEIQMLYYTLSKGKKKILSEPLYVYCYRKNEEANNYCSTRGNLEMLEDYAQGFYIIEKKDKYRINYSLIKLKYYESYIDRIIETKDWRQIIRIADVLQWRDILSFLGLKILLKMNNYRMPQFILKRKRIKKV